MVMNVVRRAVLAVGALLLASPAWADGKLDAFLESVRAKHALPALAAAAVKNGEVIARSAVGVRALGTDVPVTVDDRFHLGSASRRSTPGRRTRPTSRPAPPSSTRTSAT
jgi:CubicO group peptidase (beta-lactamase class C family)